MFMATQLRQWTLAAGLLIVPCLAGSLAAQQVTVSSPFNSVGHGFYEGIGTNWGARGPGWFFNFGGGAPGVAPQFGGFDPNAGANGGVGFRGGNVNGFLNFTAGQGADSTFVSQTPSVTIPNGGNGMFIDGSFRPFVTGIVPVVGAQADNSDSSPLRERLRRLQSGEVKVPVPEETASTPIAGGGGNARGSSAERGAQSVAAIKAQAVSAQQTEDTELAAMLEKAQGAEAAGKPGVAKVFYQMAARRATGARQREILARLEALPK
ncbi:hypothetical protein [Anatilimnocola floriformis]|uniref:hypothetical protein n=1 Tax=Anatilimnocola floriformis TaxID=2948575 RepID=UPI0020C47310|nr:hypothetical protein [Anatilimnocola floriformis]